MHDYLPVLLRLLSLLCFLFVSSCASTHKYAVGPDYEDTEISIANSGRLIFFAPPLYKGSNPEVSINERDYVPVGMVGYHIYHLKPGTHLINVKDYCFEDSLVIDVKAGETIYVGIGYMLKEVSKSEALYELKTPLKLEYTVTDPIDSMKLNDKSLITKHGYFLNVEYKYGEKPGEYNVRKGKTSCFLRDNPTLITNPGVIAFEVSASYNTGATRVKFGTDNLVIRTKENCIYNIYGRFYHPYLNKYSMSPLFSTIPDKRETVSYRYSEHCINDLK